MLLTKLEIKGFKSFGDRIVLRLNEGVTGIVGPNGCGKSNIVDAIRWVLGEQSTRNLRSEKMDNIIFNGTAKRKAAEYAEVQLTFENNRNLLPQEYTSVTIGRRYNRNGQSDYILNGENCRRKDIQDLLLNTGITSNSYAIIELKMVEDILNDRDNARKSMFEEAAGITKYKSRKKETLKRLEESDADLSRVEDLLFEIDKNMKNLERQARQAMKYNDAREEYQRLSLAFARKVFRKYTEEYTDLYEKIQTDESRRNTFLEQLRDSEAQMDAQKESSLKKEEELNKKRQLLGDVLNKIRQSESDQRLHEERIRYLKEKKENLEWQISQEDKTESESLAAIQGLEQQLQNAEKQFRDSERVLQEFKDQFISEQEKLKVIKEEVDIADGQFKARESEIQLLQKTLELRQNQKDELFRNLEQAQTGNKEFENQIAALEAEKKTHQKFQAEAMLLVDTLLEEERILLSSLADSQEQLEAAKEQQRHIRTKLDTKTSEFQLKSDLLQKMEGFSQASKLLVKEKSFMEQAILLTDIPDTEPKYINALNVLLEPFAQAFVTHTYEHAQKALELLAEKKAGRGQFIALDRLKKFVPKKKDKISFAIPAIECIQYAPEYRDVMYWILNNAYILKDNFWPEGIEAEEGSVYVSADGKHIYTKYTLSGGQIQVADALRAGKKHEIDLIAAEIEQLKIDLKNAGSIIEEVFQNEQRLKQKIKELPIEEARQKLRSAEQQHVLVVNRMEQIRSFVADTQKRTEELKQRMSELEAEIQQIVPRIEKAQEERERYQNRYELLYSDWEDKNIQLKQTEQAYNTYQMEYFRLNNLTENLRKEKDYKQGMLKTFKEKGEQNRLSLIKTTEDTQVASLELQAIQEQQGLLNSKKTEAQTEVQKAEQEFYQLREHIADIERQSKEVSRQRENLDARYMGMQNRLNEVKVQIAATRERMSAEFNVELNDELLSQEMEEDRFSEDELKEMVHLVKDRLQKFGSINATALEAFEEVSKRFEFITEQKADLVSARNELLQTMEEMEKTAKNAFLDAFERIRTNFRKVFQTFFEEGDDCDLLLENPEDPLESKIDIVAKPKGKRPLSIRQLSGGEKTLTATSLLFAFYLLRPAPFCIFDEVDAPLDDANVDKFNQIIQSFTEHVQFILVTHNKRTMAHTDIIYGVTIQEQGVSRIVPLDLRSLQIEA